MNEYNGAQRASMLPIELDSHIPTAVAVSGGVDSVCLLHALHQQLQSQHPLIHLWAFHIHHGLQTQADQWLAQVQTLCAQWDILFAAKHLDASTYQSAQSVEAWAREARYQALAELAQQHGVRQIVLAHHQDDQIETYLLQKKRGAGARGLSAMPAKIERNGVVWLRPWLQVSRAQIEQYASAQQLHYVDDPSNQNTRFSRNEIRAQLRAQPLSAEQRNAIMHTIAQAQAQNQADSAWAQNVLQQHAVAHRAEIGECARLRGIDLQRFDASQQAVLLREWMAQMGWRMPSRSALSELQQQLSKNTLDHQMCWRHADGWGITRLKQDWIAARLLPAGQWWLTEALRESVAQEGLEIRARSGGERFRLAPNRPRVDLKQAYQQHGIAPMLRAQLPLLYRGQTLVYVVGVGNVIDV